MKKLPLYVAVSNQKGGVGKSTLTTSLASYLHYVMEKNVLVVDCDYPQHSISNLRDRDKKQIMASQNLQQIMVERHERTGRKAFRLVNSPSDQGCRTARSYLKENADFDCDIVFLDLPGTLNTEGVLNTIINTDYVITPIIPDRMIMQSTLSFSKTVRETVMKKPGIPLKDILLLWNRIDRRVSPRAFNAFNEVIAILGMTLLETIIPETHRFDKELSPGEPFFRSTLFPPSPSLLKGSNLDLLAEELCRKFKI